MFVSFHRGLRGAVEKVSNVYRMKFYVFAQHLYRKYLKPHYFKQDILYNSTLFNSAYQDLLYGQDIQEGLIGNFYLTKISALKSFATVQTY